MNCMEKSPWKTRRGVRVNLDLDFLREWFLCRLGGGRPPPPWLRAYATAVWFVED